MVSELKLLQREATDCLAKASIPPQEWNSYCEEFNTYIDDEERRESPTVLGVQWNTQEDTLSIKSNQVEEI